MSHPALVMVEWVDTTNIATWTSLEDVPDFANDCAYICRNVGYLVYEDADCVVLAARTALGVADPQVGLFERVPKAVIKRRWTLTKHKDLTP